MIAAPPTVTSAYCLLFPKTNLRGYEMFQPLARTARAAGIDWQESPRWEGPTTDLLLLWGPGAPDRFEPMRKQIAAGGHVIAFDLAYWSRDRKIRCAVDGPHPQRWLFAKDWPADRFSEDPVRTRDVWNPDGPVIVAGIGPKSKIQYGAERVALWEEDLIRQCQAAGKTVRYRRKHGVGTAPAGTALTPDGPIEAILAGAALVITWHSNVAVDAIRLGIPVVCQDGAAAAVCPHHLRPWDEIRPLTHDVRDRFLRNLAWFQWAPSEAAGFWAFCQELLTCSPR